VLSGCCQGQRRERMRARKPLINLEPAIGLEPMTGAFRVPGCLSDRKWL